MATIADFTRGVGVGGGQGGTLPSGVRLVLSISCDEKLFPSQTCLVVLAFSSLARIV